MKVSTTITLVQLLAVCWAGVVWGYNENHGPFAEDELPKMFAIYTCDRLQPRDPNIWLSSRVAVFGKKDRKSMPSVRVTQFPKIPEGTAIEIINAQGDVLFGPQQISRFHSSFINVEWADLNRDGKEDFTVWLWYSGCGLGTGYFDIAFVISDKGGYKSMTVTTLFPGPEDFVELKRDGRCQFIHTSFVYGEKGRDGKTHNYWVYNLLEIADSRVVVNNKLDKRFPKWIWYTYKPNHKDTTQLTNEQKQRLWKNHFQGIFWEPKSTKTKKEAKAFGHDR